MQRRTYRGDLIAAHAEHKRALEAAGQVGKAIATAHSRHLNAIRAADEAQAEFDRAMSTGNKARLVALIDEQVPAAGFPELQQRVTELRGVVQQCEQDVALLTDERRQRDGAVAIAAAGITSAIGYLLEPQATEMLARLQQLRDEAAGLVNELREFPSAALPAFWQDEREPNGDTSRAHQWRDVVQALTHNPNAPTEPKNG